MADVELRCAGGIYTNPLTLDTLSSSGSFSVPDVDLPPQHPSSPGFEHPYLPHGLYKPTQSLHPTSLHRYSILFKMPSAANLVRFFALSVAAISAMASPTSTSGFLPLNPELKSLVGREPEPYLSTNAQRMARGLPPKRPNFGVRRLAARQSPTLCAASIGKIRADLDSPSSTGYVAAALNAFGEFTYTENAAEALEVSICSSDSAPFDIKTTVSSN